MERWLKSSGGSRLSATVCISGHHCIIVYADEKQLYPQDAKRPGVNRLWRNKYQPLKTAIDLSHIVFPFLFGYHLCLIVYVLCKNRIKFNSAAFSTLNFLSNEGFKCVSSNTVLLHSNEDSEAEQWSNSPYWNWNNIFFVFFLKSVAEGHLWWDKYLINQVTELFFITTMTPFLYLSNKGVWKFKLIFK